MYEERLQRANSFALSSLLREDGQEWSCSFGDLIEPGLSYNLAMAAAETSPFRVVHTVCSHDCPDSCAVLVTVDANGRAIKVQGDPSQPVTQGFLCGKVAKYLDRVYSPQRILYPLKRKAGVAKGR